MLAREDIPIFLTIDNSYAPYASCTIASISENSSKKYNYKIYILHQELTKDNILKISNLQTENVQIIFKEMKEGLEKITDRVENRLRCDYFTLTIYFRLFISDIFPQYDEGIYIDSDTIVTGDISELYNKDLKDNLIGASTDHSIQDIPELVKYMEQAIGVKKHEYINSGVLLMNLKEMRKTEFSKKFLTLLDKYHFDSVAPDQDYLNAMCNGKILYLDETWDAMPSENKEELKNPKLIHYNLFQKPWCYDNIQYENVFWNYAKRSTYYNEIVEHKKNYSEEQKESDQKCLNTLIHKADTIPDVNNITFKKVFESGENIRIT